LSTDDDDAGKQVQSAVNPAAVAAAAEKADAEEKARAEAAKAAAADSRVPRLVAYADLDAKGNPEFDAIVNLNADDHQKEGAETKAAGTDANGEDVPSQETAGPPPRKRAADADESELGRRAKIERLTDFCDRLLERGVLVYDSTREQLCIEVRERRGEQLVVDCIDANAYGDASAACAGEQANENSTEVNNTNEKNASTIGESTYIASSGDAAPSQQQEFVYVNRRVQPAAINGTEEDDGVHPLLRQVQDSNVGVPIADVFANNGNAVLLWQYRWTASPEQWHGPFDSVTMQGWMQVSCFSEERPADVRQCDSNNEPLEHCWHKWDTIDFRLYL